MSDEPLDVAEYGTPFTSSDGNTTVFRAFEAEEFLEWPAWERLLRILRSNGGSYGLSGARGAGKSWLMLRAIEWVRATDAGRFGGIGLWYPSPSEYDPLAFLASLSDSFATEIDRWFRRNPRVRRRLALERVILVGFGFGVAVALSTTFVQEPLSAATAWVGAGVIAAIAAGLALRTRFHPFRREARLAAEAKVVRERARYTATRRESAEFGAEGGRGLVARARTARERELVERPATLSSLVNDFRALAAEAGAVAGSVVIAIDELDKMADPEKVRALLRDIKGIFEVPHVYFLVSVSDEAARSLSLGALAGRDEFNSSFYTVIEAKPTSPEQLAELLERRSDARVPREVALVLAALAGGNPREVLRLAELAATATTAAEAAVRALQDEALIFRREVVTAPEVDGLPSVGPDARMRAFMCLPDASVNTADGLANLAEIALSDEMWQPNWEDDGFRVRFGEPWRRLMIRLAVAGKLVASRSLVRDPDLALRLRDVVVAASQSAEVARTVLERELRVETQRPSVEREQARERLEALARRYERIRQAQRPSAERTNLMDSVAADARSLARDAGLTTRELTSMLESDAAGDRVVALATIEATGEPETFEPVLATATRPATPFEGYHALRALETLLPSLTPHQRAHVADAFSDDFKKNLSGDAARAALADRIIETVKRKTGAPA